LEKGFLFHNQYSICDDSAIVATTLIFCRSVKHVFPILVRKRRLRRESQLRPALFIFEPEPADLLKRILSEARQRSVQFLKLFSRNCRSEWEERATGEGCAAEGALELSHVEAIVIALPLIVLGRRQPLGKTAHQVSGSLEEGLQRGGMARVRVAKDGVQLAQEIHNAL
jgi:hypothetical protein